VIEAIDKETQEGNEAEKKVARGGGEVFLEKPERYKTDRFGNHEERTEKSRAPLGKLTVEPYVGEV
jgi:hypothetical protein